MRGRSAWLVTALVASALLPGTATFATADPPGVPADLPLFGPDPIDPIDPSAPDGAPPTEPAAPESTLPETTLPAPPPDTFNPDCVWVVRPGDSVSLIANLVGDATTGDLIAANQLGRNAVIHAGNLLDVCPHNDVNDITGASLLRPDTVLIPNQDVEGIKRQQAHLNSIFAGYGIAELTVDGQSGRLTRQQLCAARLMLGLPVSRSDMEIGSDEEAALATLTTVRTPPLGPRPSGRWAFIDMTCQVMFVGDDSGVRFVFPTSTGEAGYETRVVSEARSFRFDPATQNNGWHDSSEFPVGYDNPLNGNMYKPIYFSNGQAIHGANNVPTSPASKGCVRLRVGHMDQLVEWLGLADKTSPVWNENTIGLRVTTRGSFSPDP